jgi:FkbM family methyltransferase
MLRALVSMLPPRVVRAVGRLQFRSPLVAKAVSLTSDRLTGTGTIRHGLGAGLRFDSTGGYPGYLLGTSEPDEQAFVARTLRDGDVFYDIGANIGFYSTIAARSVGPDGHVHAFEPHPDSSSRAARNAALNDFTNVTVVTAAVSDHDGRMTLSLAGGSASHRLGAGPGIEVEVISIDRWVRETGSRPPTFVMIDVEGEELAVLDGMKATLVEHRPTVCCEVHWLGRAFIEYYDREIRPLGYRLSDLNGGPPLPGANRWHAVLRPEPGLPPLT